MEKLYRYQQDGQFFAQIAHHLEELGCEELLRLGASEAKAVYRGIWFSAEASALYKIVYQTRLCSRMLAPLIRFDCHSDRYLYKTASSIAWNDFLTTDQTFAISATVSHSRIKHSKFAALRLKDAIVDFFRDKFGDRPGVDRHNPDVHFHLHIENNHAIIHLDAGGGSLHRRGYRTETVEAPMQETVAAAVIRYSEWDGELSLHDPMCGSGTLLAEAMMSVRRIPAAYLIDSFGFQRMPDYDAAIWELVKNEADGRICPLPDSIELVGSDINSDAVAATKKNLQRLPGGDAIRVFQKDVFRLEGIADQVIITNPPYGLRIGKRDDISSFYKRFGDFLKQKCNGSSCFLYAGKRELLKSVGLKTTWKKPLVSGALEGRLARYDIY